MYTFAPKEKYAKAFGRNLRISTKSATILCRAIRKKTLTRAKRLLQDLASERRGLDGKHYTKTAMEMILLLGSCEKNADNMNLDKNRLFVHASAHTGTIMRRRRRKAAFGSRLKSTNLEIMLIERGKEGKKKADIRVVRSKEDMEKVVREVAEKVAAKQAVKKEEEANKEDEKAKETEVKSDL